MKDLLQFSAQEYEENTIKLVSVSATPKLVLFVFCRSVLFTNWMYVPTFCSDSSHSVCFGVLQVVLTVVAYVAPVLAAVIFQRQSPCQPTLLTFVARIGSGHQGRVHDVRDIVVTRPGDITSLFVFPHPLDLLHTSNLQICYPFETSSQIPLTWLT